MTEPPLRPKISITGLLNLLAWVEQKRAAHAAEHEEGGVSWQDPRPSRFPPPVSRPRSLLWEQLPQANRQRLLWLLSHLIERQLEHRSEASKEDGDDLDTRAE